LPQHFSGFSTPLTYGRRFITLFRAQFVSFQLESTTFNLKNSIERRRHHVTYRRRLRPRVAVVAAAVACRAVARWGRHRRTRSGPVASGRCRCRRRRPPNRNRCRRRPCPPCPTATATNLVISSTSRDRSKFNQINSTKIYSFIHLKLIRLNYI